MQRRNEVLIGATVHIDKSERLSKQNTTVKLDGIIYIQERTRPVFTSYQVGQDLSAIILTKEYSIEVDAREIQLL